MLRAGRRTYENFARNLEDILPRGTTERRVPVILKHGGQQI